MKKIIQFLIIVFAFNINAKIEVLDRVAVIVDDGVIMESQIKNTILDIQRRYEDQNIPMPPMEILLDQITEKLIVEELQLQLADRAGVKISDAELNVTLDRLASNNNMSLEEFIAFIENDGGSYEQLREDMRREMRIQRVQRGRVDSSIDITEKEFEEAGVNIVIYANHMLRAAYPAMYKTAKSILQNKRAFEAREFCMSIKEILEIIPGTKNA